MPRKYREITEHEEQHCAHQWQIERSEDDAYKARRDYGSSLYSLCGLPLGFAFWLGYDGYFAHFFFISFYEYRAVTRPTQGLFLNEECRIKNEDWLTPLRHLK